jgi:hypothetical protein
MASKSGGWSPPSGREHPPFKGGQKTSSVGSNHCAGPMTNNDTSGAGKAQSNAVSRPPHGISTK